MEQRINIRRLADNRFISDFKAFILKQNILSLAIAVVVGTALNTLVKALVDDFIMPVVGVLVPSGEWEKATWGVGSVQFGIGHFMSALLNFLIVGFVAWRITRQFLGADAPPPPPPPTKACEFCRMAIDPLARRCPHCTSQLAAT